MPPKDDIEPPEAAAGVVGAEALATVATRLPIDLAKRTAIDHRRHGVAGYDRLGLPGVEGVPISSEEVELVVLGGRAGSWRLSVSGAGRM